MVVLVSDSTGEPLRHLLGAPGDAVNVARRLALRAFYRGWPPRAPSQPDSIPSS